VVIGANKENNDTSPLLVISQKVMSDVYVLSAAAVFKGLSAK
jgi:hypothetical protein